VPVNGVIKLGYGKPAGVASIAAEEGLLDHATLTAEPGVIGGQPASGLDFGAAVDAARGLDVAIEDQDRFYGTVTRYAGSAFMRMKLRQTLSSPTPHIYETQEAARAVLNRDQA